MRILRRIVTNQIRRYKQIALELIFMSMEYEKVTKASSQIMEIKIKKIKKPLKL
jgi:hypothetical protein